MPVGVVLAVVAAFSFNAGFVLEKQALARLPEIHARRSFHMLRTLASAPLWLIGFAMSLFGLGCQVLALSRAPLSVVQPILASGIVVLLLLSHFALKERLGAIEWWGIGAVIAALFLVGVSLDAKAERIGTASSFGRILVVSVPTAALAGLSFFAAGRRQRGSAPLYGLAAGLVYGVAGVATKAVSVVVETDGLVRAIPKVLASPDLYLLLGFAAAGLLAFQTGLQRGRASVVVPVSSVMSAAYPIAIGMALFGEHLPESEWRVVVRFVGFAGVLVGMFLLAGGRTLEAAYAPGDEPVDRELEAAASGM